jgi:mRNA interferase RelE/StbE
LQSLQQEEVKTRIKQVIESLTEYPLCLRELDVQKMEGLERTFRLRVGGYRVIFSVVKNERAVFVTKIEKRESAYE